MHHTLPVRRTSAPSNLWPHQAHWMAAGAGAREYTKELLVLLDAALLFRLLGERNAHDLVFGKQTVLLMMNPGCHVPPGCFRPRTESAGARRGTTPQSGSILTTP